MGLLENLKSASRHKKLIDWPAKDSADKILLKTNTESDYIEATKATEGTFKGITIGMENIAKYDSEFEDQLLMRACFDPDGDGDKLLTSSAATFKDLMTPEVKDALADELDQLHAEFAPNPDKMTEDEYNEVVAEVKKNAQNTVLSITNISLLRRLLLTLASQLSS